MPIEVMLTTDGDACLKIAIVDFSPGIKSPRGETWRGLALGLVSVAPTNHDCCVSTKATEDSAIAGQKYFAKREIDIGTGCLFIGFHLFNPRLHFGASVKTRGGRLVCQADRKRDSSKRKEASIIRAEIPGMKKEQCNLGGQR